MNKRIIFKARNIFLILSLVLSPIFFSAIPAEAAFSSVNQVEDKLGQNRFRDFGWWGQINNDYVAVREKPSNKSKLLGSFSKANRVKILEEVGGDTVGDNDLWYRIDGGQYPGAYISANFVDTMQQPKPEKNFSIPDGVSQDDYWVDVNLTKQILTLFKYDKPIFVTYVSTGRKGDETMTGTFRIWYKLYKTRMHGGPPIASHFYDLPNVPYTMFYHGSYALHGTYWHDRFGVPQSAGCTNLTQGDAKFLFNKLSPKMDSGVKFLQASSDNQGTVVKNHN